MANWLNKLEITDLHQQFRLGEIDVETLGKKVAERLKEVAQKLVVPKQFNQIEKENLVEELNELADQFENEIFDDVENYDYILGELYDLADSRLAGNSLNPQNLLWINTFG